MTDLAYTDEPVIEIPGFLNCEPVPPTAFINLARDYVGQHTLMKQKPPERLRRDAKRVAQTVATLSIVVPLDGDVMKINRGTGIEYTQLRLADGVSTASIRRELTVLGSILNHAVKWERLPKAPKIFKPETSAPRLMFLTREQHAELLRLPMSRRMKLFWMLAFGTGARSEAIEEATWDRINWTDRTLDYRVPGVLYKNKRRVVAPLNSKLFARLQHYYTIRDESDPYIIGRGKPRKNKVSTTYHEAARCMEAIGLTDDGIARHIARHTFATWLLQARVPLNRVAHLLGDKASMVESTYGHLAPSDLFDDTEKILEQLAA